MSVNTAHANNGVLIHAGEYILLHSDSVTMDFSGSDNSLFKGSKHGRIYLTSHRMIFNNKKSSDVLQSFSAPFVALSDVEIEQPVFGANYIRGKVRAQPNGNFIGEVKFKLHFKAGGAIEYGQALLRAAKTAQSNFHRGGLAGDDPPPYQPAGAWHEAPPPAYQPPPGYYGWLPQHDAFSGPAPNTVFISDNPPPYPGIVAPPAYNPNQPQPAAPQQPPPHFQQNNDPPATWYGFSAPPAEQQQPSCPQGWAGPAGYGQPPPYGAPQGYAGPQSNYMGGAAAYQPGQQPGQQPPMYPQPYGGYNPPQPGGYASPGHYAPPPPQQQNGQQQPTQPAGAPAGAAAAGTIGALGFSLPPSAKADEAILSPNSVFSSRNRSTTNSEFLSTFDDLMPYDHHALQAKKLNDVS